MYLAVVFLSVFMQVLNPSAPLTQPGAPAPSDLVIKPSSTAVPAGPSVNGGPARLTQTELNTSAEESSPFAITGIERNIAKDGQAYGTKILNVGGGLAKIRHDLIVGNPRVIALNNVCVAISKVMLGVLVAMLGLRGVVAPLFGSDAQESAELLMPLMVWALAAATSMRWITLMVDGFGFLAGALAGVAQSALGPGLDPGMVGVGQIIVQLLVVIVYCIAVIFVALNLWMDTLFLALMVGVAPVLLITMPIPFLSKFGNTWWRMVPGTLADMVLIGAALSLFSPVIDQFIHAEPLDSLLWRLAGIFLLFKLRHIFGTGLDGGRNPILTALFLARMRGGFGHGGGGSAAAAVGSAGPSMAGSMPEASPATDKASETVARVPRYIYQGVSNGTGAGRAVTGKADAWEPYDGD